MTDDIRDLSGNGGQRVEGQPEAARQLHHLWQTQPRDQAVQQPKRGVFSSCLMFAIR